MTDPPSSTNRSRPIRSVDYLERQARSRDVGLKGEFLVVEYERQWLSAHGHRGLADLLGHVLTTIGDGAGYDVGSSLGCWIRGSNPFGGGECALNGLSMSMSNPTLPLVGWPQTVASN